MKPTAFIPPVAALAVAGIWLGSQSRSISSITTENTLLRQRLEAARLSPESGGAGEGVADGSASTKGKRKKVDWKQIALKLGQQRGGDTSDMRAAIELQRILVNLTPEELMAGLEEVSAMDLSAEAKRQMESMLIGLIGEEHPELVIQHFEDRFDEDGLNWQLPGALHNWAKKDLAAATAWIDRQIAEGKLESKSLDGRSESRIRFEGALIGSLLEVDPAAARARVEDLPEDQRSSLFTQGMFFRIKPANEKAVADLIRGAIGEGKSVHTLGIAGSQLVHQGGYDRVGNFMASVSATPAEREAIVGTSLQNMLHQGAINNGNPTPAFEEGLAWARKEAPESINRIIGSTIADISWRGNYDDAAKMALKYHEESGNDEVLATFLSKSGPSQPEKAYELADKIADEGKRAEIKKQLENKLPKATR